MNSKAEKAIRSFRADLNCAQSVLTAYAEDFNLDPDLLSAISCGFGGGMGRLQETCGAVTGAFMVFGIHNSKNYKENKDLKDKTYAMVQQFSEKFKAIHGTLDCHALLNCDMKTEEGQRHIKANRLHETICEKCVADSVRIIDEIIASGSQLNNMTYSV
jgi:C_GCAxxG_C_C family probable redox protein